MCVTPHSEDATPASRLEPGTSRQMTERVARAVETSDRRVRRPGGFAGLGDLFASALRAVLTANFGRCALCSASARPHPILLRRLQRETAALNNGTGEAPCVTTLQRVFCCLGAAALVGVLLVTEKICIVGNTTHLVIDGICSYNSRMAPQYDLKALAVRGTLVVMITTILVVAFKRRGS